MNKRILGMCVNVTGWVAVDNHINLKDKSNFVVKSFRRHPETHEDFAICVRGDEKIELTDSELRANCVNVFHPEQKKRYRVEGTRPGKNGRKGFIILQDSDPWAIGGFIYRTKPLAVIEKMVLEGRITRDRAQKALVRMGARELEKKGEAA